MALGWVASFELDLGQQPVQIHLPRLPLPLLPGQSSRLDGGREAGTVLKLPFFLLSLPNMLTPNPNWIGMTQPNR